MSSDKPTIILFSTADWNEPYWTNKQHTAEILVKLGCSVVYVESIGLRAPKLGSGKDIKRILNRIAVGAGGLLKGAKVIKPNLAVLAPLVIPNPNKNKLIAALNTYILRFLVGREINQRGKEELIIWSYHPFIMPLLDGLNKGTLVYHCVDDLSKVPGVPEAAFIEAEEQFLKLASHVFVTTKPLEERCKPFSDSVHFHSNVVDFEHFNNPRVLSSGFNISTSDAKKAVYHGVLSDFKVDFSLLLDVAKRLPEVEFYLLGTEREGQKSPVFAELCQLDNIFHLGFVPYDDLPALLARMDVGLLPTLINDYTRSMFPMKYYEYIAAGLPVVSTKIEFTTYTSNTALTVADNAQCFGNAIVDAVAKPKLTREQSEKLVGSNTWLARTKAMLDIIKGSEV